MGGSEGEGEGECWGAVVLEGIAPALILAKTNLGLARETQRQGDKRRDSERQRLHNPYSPFLHPSSNVLSDRLLSEGEK